MTDGGGPDASSIFSGGGPDTLIFSGGGQDGLAFIGCIRRMEESPETLSMVKTIVGCSAGAMVGSMLAVGMDSRAMESLVLRSVDDKSFVELDIEGVFTAAERLGLDDGERVMAPLRSVVMERYGTEDVTFIDLLKSTGKCLVICVTNLEECRQELMSVDTTPDLGILAAVRMSISFPMIFAPVRWRGRTYVDGGLSEYCPTSHLYGDSRSARSALAFHVTSPTLDKNEREKEEEEKEEEEGRPTLSEYVGMLVEMVRRTFVQCEESNHRKCEEDDPTRPFVLLRRVEVHIPQGGYAAFDMPSMSLMMDEDVVSSYILRGHEAVSAVLPSSHSLSDRGIEDADANMNINIKRTTESGNHNVESGGGQTTVSDRSDNVVRAGSHRPPESHGPLRI
jgi:predicted acylesterase/phospholipase RssA